MRLLTALLTCTWLGACATSAPPAPSEQGLVRNSDWRQHQVALDVQAILAGMARAQAEAQAMARTAR